MPRRERRRCVIGSSGTWKGKAMPVACPKCHAKIEGSLPECPACGVIFAKIRPGKQAAPLDSELTQSEAEFIDGALEAGIEFGLEALPARIRDKVDVEEATALARRRLSRGIFRQHLAELDESLRGLERIVEASEDPALAVLEDPIQLSQMFGLKAQQAAILVRETLNTIAYLRKPPIRGVERPLTKEDVETVRRVMRRRIRQAVEAQAELQGQTLAKEAIETARQSIEEFTPQ